MKGAVSGPQVMPSVRVPMPGQSSLDGTNSSSKSDSTCKNINPPLNSDRKTHFSPSSPIGSHQPVQLDDGWWEFGMDVQGQMVKSVGPMMDKLGKGLITQNSNNGPPPFMTGLPVTPTYPRSSWARIL